MRYLSTLLLILFLSCNTTENPVQTIQLDYAGDTLSVFSSGIVSTGHTQRDVAINKEGTEIFYTGSTPSNGFRALIQVNLGDDGSIVSREVASFSGTHSDIEPFYTPDQNRLFFASDRPTNETDTVSDYNIWYVERNGDSWGEPVALGDSVNTPTGNEFYPSLSSNGNLYFTASYQRGLEYIWKSEWKDGYYATPLKLDSAINSSRYQFNAYITPDENLLLFSSYGRADGFGGGDLYAAKRGSNGQWEPAYNLGADINSDKLDYCPYYDQERGVFYFTSNRSSEITKPVTLETIEQFNSSAENGMGSIYRINASKLSE